jgi:hypothetical protein
MRGVAARADASPQRRDAARGLLVQFVIRAVVAEASQTSDTQSGAFAGCQPVGRSVDRDAHIHGIRDAEDGREPSPAGCRLMPYSELICLARERGWHLAGCVSGITGRVNLDRYRGTDFSRMLDL